MPVTQKMIGKGLTKRPSMSISAPFGEEELGAMHRWVDAYNSISTFERIAVALEVFCQGVLANANLPSWEKCVRIYANGKWADDLPEDWHQRLHEILKPGESTGYALNIVELRDGIDSPEWFAAQILDSIDIVRQVIASKDPASIAYHALHLGTLTETAKWKFTWETDALLGKDTRQKRKKANAESIKTRREDRQKRLNSVRSEAIALWRNDPTLRSNLTQTAVIIAKELDFNAQTVRSDLKKPEEWSTL